MPYNMKIQPIDFNAPAEEQQKFEAVVKPVFRSRFKRLFERPFSSVLKTSAPDKPAGATEPLQNCNKDVSEELEPSSVCLAKMVQNFMEEGNEKQQQRCGRNRCICFNRNCSESSDEELDSYNFSFSDACDILKSLAPCVCVSERNLLADTSKIVERNKINKHKDGFCRKIVADGLISLGYNAAICKSKWEKSPSFLAGEYEYVDVIIEGERLIVDIDFRSEFNIARPTKAYKLVHQTLPNIFVGKADRLDKIIGIVTEASKQSLKKKGMHFPPWRKADYVKSKWFSPFTRIDPRNNCQEIEVRAKKDETSSLDDESAVMLEAVEKSEDGGECVFVLSSSSSSRPCEDEVMKKWELPEIRPKSANKGMKIVTGLASLIDNKP